MKVELKPIRTEKDHKEALKLIDLLWDSKPNTPNYDILDILVTLVEVYEERNFTIDLPDPIETIKYKMDQLGLKRVDLGKFLGGRSRASEILERKRKLSLTMIRKLNQELHIPTEILIKDYKLKTKILKVKSAA
ncbi:MAG: transcriptional regulator [Leptospiraceae bacterium]|nr:transcriptional regulator [Leptospiraceae bacterium]